MLLTKLHKPSGKKKLVERKELFTLLNQSLECKLILVSAPAGFGKTSLIGNWIKQNKKPTAWFSIDNNDNDPIEFISYIITSLQSIQENFGQKILEIIQSGTPPSIPTIMNLITNEILNIKQNFLLVLDDYHSINNEEVNKMVNHLLEYLPENMQVVIISRSDPNLSLAKLRSRQHMVEVRAKDLSFTSHNIEYLFNYQLKLSLSDNEINILRDKTEGWIAGLQLVALSLKNCSTTADFIKGFKGDNRFIMDYLIEEVLYNQTAEIKEFLLKTSILQQFSAPLCNEITGATNSQSILEELETNNMFIVPLDDDRKWYRYHHLFADLLKQKLIQENINMINLHSKASLWFEQNEMFEFAIDHVLEIKDYKNAIRLLGQIAENLWEHGQHSQINRYGELLPAGIISGNPEFSLYYSWVLISSGKVEEARQFLINSEKELVKKTGNNQCSENDNKHNKLLGKTYVALAYLYSNFENFDKICMYCEAAKNHLDESTPLWYSFIWYSLGIAHHVDGNFNKSNEAFNLALKYAKISGTPYLISTIFYRTLEYEELQGHYTVAYKKCIELLNYMQKSGYSDLVKQDWTFAGLYSKLSGFEFLWMNLEKALEYIKTAYELSKNAKDLPLKTFILMMYSMILHENGKVKMAQEKMHEMEMILKDSFISPFVKSAHIAWKVFLLIEMDDLEQAEVFIQNQDLDLGEEKNHINEISYIPYARLLIAQNKFTKAEKLLNELFIIADEGNRIERLIEINILYTVLYKNLGEGEKAKSSLTEALKISAKENILLFFSFDINPIHEVLLELEKDLAFKNHNISKEYINRLKLIYTNKQKRNNLHPSYDLSKRELDTLKLIAQNLTNQEIADKLFISLNTCKTHVKSILLKLNVENRGKAAQKAKDLGII